MEVCAGHVGERDRVQAPARNESRRVAADTGAGCLSRGLRIVAGLRVDHGERVMSDRSQLPPEQDDAVAKIIRLAGRRPVAPAAARARVYAAAHAAWQQSLAAPSRTRPGLSVSRRQPLLWLAAAASVAAIAL